MHVKALLQLSSSELSTQSLVWSHLYSLGMHWPSRQVNWSGLQVRPSEVGGGGGRQPTGIEMWKNKQETKTPAARELSLRVSERVKKRTAGSLLVRAVLAVLVPVTHEGRRDALPVCHAPEIL